MAKRAVAKTVPVPKTSGNPDAVRKKFDIVRSADGALMAVARDEPEARFRRAYGILDIHRPFKTRRYFQKRNNPAYRGPVIVAEGDSWFEFPLTKDILMWLGETYAVLSLAKAGDAWSDIQDQNELLPAVRREKPNIVLLSVGGNEIMGNIDKYVHTYDAALGRDDYLRPNFAPLLDWISGQYELTINQILTIRPSAHVIIHGYDYPNPREWQQGGQWIGGPLENMLRIGDHTMWRHVANMMLDQFNERQRDLARRLGPRVHYLDLRKTIGRDDDEWLGPEDNWDDEIHGTSEAFGVIAARFAAKIDEIAPAGAPLLAAVSAAGAKAKKTASVKKKRRQA